jgi:hypothetical protein
MFIVWLDILVHANYDRALLCSSQPRSVLSTAPHPPRLPPWPFGRTPKKLWESAHAPPPELESAVPRSLQVEQQQWSVARFPRLGEQCWPRSTSRVLCAKPNLDGRWVNHRFLRIWTSGGRGECRLLRINRRRCVGNRQTITPTGKYQS